MSATRLCIDHWLLKRFELMINLRTAKAIGHEAVLVLRGDKVIG